MKDYKKMMDVFEKDEGLKKWNKITLSMTKSKPDLRSALIKLDLIFDYQNGKLIH